MLEEAMILDGNEGVLEISGNSLSDTSWRCSSIRNHRRPSAREEPGVAHAAAQLVNGPRLAQRPGQT